MSRKDAAILTSVVVLPGLFAVYEMAALNGLFGLHTISWISQLHPAVAVGIAVAAVLAVVVFLAWWVHHMRSRIPR